MAKITRMLPADMILAPTLAGRVNQLRIFRNLTVRDLAREARMTEQRIDDIESGLETWLSTTDRQILARALRVDPVVLKEVEYEPEQKELRDPPQEVLQELADKILGGVKETVCPRCKKSTLSSSVQEGFDLQGDRMQYARAFCSNCPFVLK